MYTGRDSIAKEDVERRSVTMARMDLKCMTDCGRDCRLVGGCENLETSRFRIVLEMALCAAKKRGRRERLVRSQAQTRRCLQG